MREKVYINGIEFTKWNIIEELSTADDIIGYLTAVFEDHPTKDEVCHALVVANKAIAAHNLVLEDNWMAESAHAPPAQGDLTRVKEADIIDVEAM